MTTGLTTTTNFIAQKIDRTMVDSVTNAIFQRAASKSSQAVENSVKNKLKEGVEIAKLSKYLASDIPSIITININNIKYNTFDIKLVSSSITTTYLLN